jgi:chromosome segregation ATPase
MKMTIYNILAKYENFYKGGSGYTFQVVVDDFNAIVNYIKALEVAEKELSEEIEEHCETKGHLGKQVFALTKRVDELVEELQERVADFKGLKDLITPSEEKIERYEKALKSIANPKKLWSIDEAQLVALEVLKEPPRISINPGKSGTPLMSPNDWFDHK